MGKPLSIILVEDEAFIALNLKIGLERAGYVVKSVLATGEKAVERMDLEPTDIVVMDIRLAGTMTGIEAARRIRDRHPVPIIFMTGFTLEEYGPEIDELRPSMLLNKPVTPEELAMALEEISG